MCSYLGGGGGGGGGGSGYYNYATTSKYSNIMGKLKKASHQPLDNILWGGGGRIKHPRKFYPPYFLLFP